MKEQANRTQRQKESIKKWIQNRCIGILCLSTGVGKTHTACMAIKVLVAKIPQLSVMIVVPTTNLKKQWEEKLNTECIKQYATVQVINSAIKKDTQCDLLILDECHLFLSKQTKLIFSKCKYKYLLGLSATMERLDGEHQWLLSFCPIVDTITRDEAIQNGWLSSYVEYKVVLDVDNIDEYKELNKTFQKSLEYFNWDFSLAMQMTGKNGQRAKILLRDTMCKINKSLNPQQVMKEISYHTANLMRTLQARKKFINEHPEKIRLTQEIIKHRPDAKIITFSATSKIADSIGLGKTYTGKLAQKTASKVLQEFIDADHGVINSCAKLNTGFDCPDLNIAVILGQNSSNTTFTQRIGRCLRLSSDSRPAEIFTFVINDTVEATWFEKSHKNSPVVVVDKENLMKILNNEPYEEYKKTTRNFLFGY